MSQGPHPKSALVALTAVLLISTSSTFGQSQNQNPPTTSPSNPPTTPPVAVYSTDVPSSSTKPNPPKTGSTTGKRPTGTTIGSTTGKRPGSTTGTSGERSGSTGSRATNTPVGAPRAGSGGGSNAGAIAGGAIGAAALGISLFKSLHHAHAPNSGSELERLGLTLRYPEDWQLNPRLNLQEDPINFNNFNSSYLRGGIIPMGGADIDIAYFASVTSPVPELISSELADTNEKQIDDHTYHIGGKKGTRVFYTDVYARGFTYKNIAIYVPREYGLYKFFLTYHEGDPHEKDFNDDFEHILKSVRFQR
jgi:hypothetical protein